MANSTKLTIPGAPSRSMAARLASLRDHADGIFAFLALEQAHERGKIRSLQGMIGADALADLRNLAQLLASDLDTLARKAADRR